MIINKHEQVNLPKKVGKNKMEKNSNNKVALYLNTTVIVKLYKLKKKGWWMEKKKHDSIAIQGVTKFQCIRLEWVH